MAEVNKILGQVESISETFVDLYEVPSGKEAVVSSYTVCNRSLVDATFALTVAVGGAALDDKQFIHFQTPLEAHETFEGTLGMTLGPGDVVRAYSDYEDVNFNLFGVEITP